MPESDFKHESFRNFEARICMQISQLEAVLACNWIASNLHSKCTSWTSAEYQIRSHYALVCTPGHKGGA